MVQLYQSPGLIQFLAIEKEKRETWQHKRQLVWLQLITRPLPSGHVRKEELKWIPRKEKKAEQWIVSKLNDEDDDGSSSLGKRKKKKKDWGGLASVRDKDVSSTRSIRSGRSPVNIIETSNKWKENFIKTIRDQLINHIPSLFLILFFGEGLIRFGCPISFS
jgi:hypothetical protein